MPALTRLFPSPMPAHAEKTQPPVRGVRDKTAWMPVVKGVINLTTRNARDTQGGVELGVRGQNLTEPRHAEFSSLVTPLVTQVPRSVTGRATWRF